MQTITRFFEIDRRYLPAVVALLSSMLLIAGCDADDTGMSENDGGAMQDGGDRDDDDDGHEDAGPREDGGRQEAEGYVVETRVFTPDGTTSYVYLVDSLDSLDSLDTDTALEFPGWSRAGAYGGDLFIADGESPTITRYEADSFDEIGKLSVMNLGIQPNEVGIFVDDRKAYTSGGGPLHAIWDPKNMEILGELEAEGVDARDGFMRIRTSDQALLRSERLLRTFFWQNTDVPTFSEDTQLAVIDTETDETLSTTALTRCPVLNKMTEAEDGTIYLSTWLYGAAMHHMFDAPSTCALRIPPDSTEVDEDWVLDFEDLTDGRQAANLHYIGNGMATLPVFHHERADIEGAESPWALAQTNNWKLWLVDLEEATAEPLDDLGWSTGDHAVFRDADGRSFVALPGEDFEKTTVWEILPDGTVEEAFEATGWIDSIVRL